MHNFSEYFVQVNKTRVFGIIILVMFSQGCINGNNQEIERKSDSSLVRIITLAPGHFHAGLVQKSMYDGVDSTVYVFAPEGQDVNSYLALIREYNNRKENPTSWNEKVYAGPDYLEKMLVTKPGNVVVIAGNNKMKTENIKSCVNAGLNVLSDKPMAITKAGFDELKEVFASAKTHKVLLYDIMTSRYEITNLLQKAFSRISDVFGELQKGTLDNPAVSSQSVHYFFKEVSGMPLIRPAWYFDVEQEGEGIVDITTHLVDLIQWECFPEESLDYEKDIQMLTAKHWPTVLTPSQFRMVTKLDAYPDFLKKEVKDSLLNVSANGEMNYTIKNIHARVSVAWKFEAPQGTGDTYYSKLRGTKADLIIMQGKEQQYKPVLYIRPVGNGNEIGWQHALRAGLESIHINYPGVGLKRTKEGWEVLIPPEFNIDPEQQFSLVVKKYLEYLKGGNMPDWEISGMLAKYYTTTQALEKALNKQDKK